MKIVVCIRQGLDGEISPFDACAYEAALKIPGAEITLLSMGPISAKDFLHRLTRLGARKAILLSDKAFAGSDTLATAYTLSLAMKKICPDLIFCGRQTLIGDTGQVGPMLSVYAETDLITNVMEILTVSEREITCVTRTQGEITAKFPALITVEKINTLRFPSILSKLGEVEVWSGEDLGADPGRIGLTGSPTRVLQSRENEGGKRKCTFIKPSDLRFVVEEGLKKNKERFTPKISQEKLKKVFIVGEGPRAYAQSVSDDITVLSDSSMDHIIRRIKEEKPNAVLFGSDEKSKTLAARISAKLNLGLCADCTALETDGEKFLMLRPALSGSVIAKIESLTTPAIATVRTKKESGDLFVSVGFGMKDQVEKVKAFAKKIGAELGASRKAVDHDLMPYEYQVGLTGKTVSPPVYIAIGISGAVHHIVGMQQAGTVIAINPDKDAPIFEYADFGILAKFEDIEELL